MAPSGDATTMMSILQLYAHWAITFPVKCISIFIRMSFHDFFSEGAFIKIIREMERITNVDYANAL